MSGTEIGAIVVAALGAISGIWGYLERRKASADQKESARNAAEAAAFTLAREHYVKIIDELEEHVSWLKKELAGRAKENEALRKRLEDHEEALRKLKAQLESALEALKNQSVVMVKQATDAEI